MNVGQTSDNIFSGLRDDVTIANLQDACLKLVVLARARGRELTSRMCTTTSVSQDSHSNH